MIIKFKQSFEEFFIELNKINYIKNHCKNITFDIIKIRVNINHDILYLIVNKMIMKLNIIFKIYDKIVKLNIKFYDFHFVINSKDKKKIFEIFYTRFNAIIAFLNYLNILKIFNLK